MMGTEAASVVSEHANVGTNVAHDEVVYKDPLRRATNLIRELQDCAQAAEREARQSVGRSADEAIHEAIRWVSILRRSLAFSSDLIRGLANGGVRLAEAQRLQRDGASVAVLVDGEVGRLQNLAD